MSAHSSLGGEGSSGFLLLLQGPAKKHFQVEGTRPQCPVCLGKVLKCCDPNDGMRQGRSERGLQVRGRREEPWVTRVIC